ncbi:MAG: hypothetical protein HN548_12495 [Opitutae bacterium]|jgi:hypothetical protein|nr:hypothetical protein [Opitutae bacterium]MBT5716192.1 hypothetical protein [Opitutae bacterium]
MDYTENEDEQNGVTKWPFYMAALFIISLVIGFAYLHLKVNETLDHWQLTTCILASGLASILVFIPHLIDRFLALAFDPSKRKDEELHRKTYFDIKEMKSQLEAFSVKIDKVPTLVDKIVSDSQKQELSPDPILAQIPPNLEEIQNTLLQKIKVLEELIVQTPLLPEPDPAIIQMTQSIPLIQSSIDSLSNQVKDLQKFIQSLPTTLPEPTKIKEIIPDPSPELLENEADSGFDSSETESQTDDNLSFKKDHDSTSKPDSKEESESDVEKDDLEIEETIQETESVEMETEPDPSIEAHSSDHEQGLDVDIDDNEEDNTTTSESSIKDEKAEIPSDENEVEKEAIEETSPQEEPIKEELELDLPDPTETLRKVDAILQETDPSHIPEAQIQLKKKEDTSPKKSSTGTTSVVANVMIGIGNKPYLRGEGPGLSWDEGVPMNFIEIGKWAWSPSRKNASLTVQLYRNDNDPDQSGKIEVKAGEKIEITPDFG